MPSSTRLRDIWRYCQQYSSNTVKSLYSGIVGVISRYNCWGDFQRIFLLSSLMLDSDRPEGGHDCNYYSILDMHAHWRDQYVRKQSYVLRVQVLKVYTIVSFQVYYNYNDIRHSMHMYAYPFVYRKPYRANFLTINMIQKCMLCSSFVKPHLYPLMHGKKLNSRGTVVNSCMHTHSDYQLPGQGTPCVFIKFWFLYHLRLE